MTTLTSARLGLYFALLHTLSFVNPQPDFSVIGAMKSGTTTLQLLFDEHPNIDMCDQEVHFVTKFCLDSLRTNYSRKYFCSLEKIEAGYRQEIYKYGNKNKPTVTCTNHYIDVDDEEWYWLENGSAVSDNYVKNQSRRLNSVNRNSRHSIESRIRDIKMNKDRLRNKKRCTAEDWNKELPSASKDGQLIGDKTPAYLFHEQVAAQMKALAPDIKIIVELRDPVDRAYSHYKMLRRKDEDHCFHKTSPTGEVMYTRGALITREFDGVVRGEIQQHLGNCIEPYLEASRDPKDSILGRGKYADQLQRYYDLFPQENIIILVSEELWDDPTESLERLNEFLHLSPPLVNKQLPHIHVGPPSKPMSKHARNRLNMFYAAPNLRLCALLKRYGHDKCPSWALNP